MPPDSHDADFGVTIRAYSPDQVVFSRFTLVRVLGRGGMGVVWLAHDQRLERDVALKFLPESVAMDPRSVDDLKRETRRSLELTHPHIVRIHDFCEDQRAAAISMEYVDGGSLAKLAVEQALRCFEPEQLLPWLRQLVDALDYAHHKAKIVHRDLKPANLMITRGGDLKITDFGISATVTDSLTRVSRLMSSGATPAYSSPQQVMGERPSPADDIYSLGATVYDLVTGKPPFFSGNVLIQVQTKTAETMRERRAHLGVKGGKIPESWEKMVAACLAKDPGQRPRSVREVLDALEGRDAVMVKTNGRPSQAPAAEPAWRAWLHRLTSVRKSTAAVAPIGKDKAFGFGIAWAMLRGVHSMRGFGRWYRSLLGGLAGVGPRIAAAALPVVLLLAALVPFLTEREPGIVFNEPEFALADTAAGPAPDSAVPSVPAAATVANTPTPSAAPSTRSPATLSGEDQASAGDRGGARPRQAPAAAGAGLVEVLSVPIGATVIFDGREVGRTPLALPGVRAGTVQLTVRLAGYEDAMVTGRVNANETTRLSAELRPSRVVPPAPPPPITVQDLGIRLLWIAPGEFLMGTPGHEAEPESDEQPLTRVRFTKGYWIGETEITQRQWWLMMATNPSANTQGGERAPVERVSWQDANEFVRKLDERERAAGRLPPGYSYQLPTEAQWEYACRAATTGDYADDLVRLAVTGGRDSATRPVASLQANAWGLHDMHGNVAEWTRSWYGAYPGGAVDDFAGPDAGKVRVFRGGAYDSSLRQLRSAYRGWVSGSVGSANRGFRIVLAPEQ